MTMRWFVREEYKQRQKRLVAPKAEPVNHNITAHHHERMRRMQNATISSNSWCANKPSDTIAIRRGHAARLEHRDGRHGRYN
ncbi:hypothetical protein [Bradyrhizobium embrapense]